MPNGPPTAMCFCNDEHTDLRMHQRQSSLSRSSAVSSFTIRWAISHNHFQVARFSSLVNTMPTGWSKRSMSNVTQIRLASGYFICAIKAYRRACGLPLRSWGWTG